MRQVTMRFEEREFEVVYDPAQVTPSDLFAAVEQVGFQAVAGGLPAAERDPGLPPEERAALDIRLVTQGGAFETEAHLAPGKVTIFDYYADWCGPCLALAPKLERLLQRYPRAALRKVDIVDWESAAAKQATEDLALKAIPFVRVFGPDGAHAGDVLGADIDAIEALVREVHPGE